MAAVTVHRHREASGLAFGKPKDRLREAIQGDVEHYRPWIASSLALLAMTAGRQSR